jgi:hypothetical protein
VKKYVLVGAVLTGALSAHAETGLEIQSRLYSEMTEAVETVPCMREVWMYAQNHEDTWLNAMRKYPEQECKAAQERFNHFQDDDADANAQIKREEAERKAELERERQEGGRVAAELAKKPGARIGMTAKQVIQKTNWGWPDSVNRTIIRHGTREQWVYGDGQYLYFENGRLTAIQH